MSLMYIRGVLLLAYINYTYELNSYLNTPCLHAVYTYLSLQVQFWLYYLCPLQKLLLRNVMFIDPPLLLDEMYASVCRTKHLPHSIDRCKFYVQK